MPLCLKEKDVVIGPCRDGGYYLLGIHVKICFFFFFFSDLILFVDIDWSTDRVFEQTTEKVRKNILSYGILKTLVDIDTMEDLYRYSPNPNKAGSENENYKIKL